MGKYVFYKKNGKVYKFLKKGFLNIKDKDEERLKDKKKAYIEQELILNEKHWDKWGLADYRTLNALIDKKYAGYVDYRENPKKETEIIKISVDPAYRGLGIATKLYQDIQAKTPNKDLMFDDFTKEGRALVEKIGKINKKRYNKEKDIHEYFGKINLDIEEVKKKKNKR